MIIDFELSKLAKALTLVSLSSLFLATNAHAQTTDEVVKDIIEIIFDSDDDDDDDDDDVYQIWTVRALSLNCHNAGGDEVVLGSNDRVQLKGSVFLTVANNNGSQDRKVWTTEKRKEGYWGMFCDSRNYTATDATKFTIRGKGRQLSDVRYRVSPSLYEVDFTGFGPKSPIQAGLTISPVAELIHTGASKWFELPDTDELGPDGRLVREYAVPGGDAGHKPDIRLRIEFHRTQ